MGLFSYRIGGMGPERHIRLYVCASTCIRHTPSMLLAIYYQDS